jgi:Sigma factor regulator C-terminal/Sigma factor regulator N-terminal
MEEDKVTFELDDKKMKKMLRKAKWKAIFKYSGIALLGMIVISMAATKLIENYAHEVVKDVIKKENDIINTLISEYELGHPNTEYVIHKTNYQPKRSQGVEYLPGDGIIEAFLERPWEQREVVVKSYKVIEGVPVEWKEEVYQYSESRREYLPKVVHADELERYEQPSLFKVDKNENVVYSQETMQREMQFYRYDKRYNAYVNDLERISKFDNKVMEVALSFDKTYSLEEVKNMLPADVTQVWYWVDTPLSSAHYKGEPTSSPIWDKYVMGFDTTKTENDFIEELRIAKGKQKNGEYARLDGIRGYAQEVNEGLRKGKDEPAKEDIRIIGAVVTGDEKQLKSLQGLPFLKAISLGAVADKNQ